MFSMAGYAQESEFEPNGKPVLRIFANAHATFRDGEYRPAFDLQRVYLGYEHNFSPTLSGKAVLDVGDPGVGKLNMTAYVKNAFLQYRKNDLTVQFGMIATTQFKVQESAWGYRYIQKSFMDAYKWNASADLGVSAAYRIAEFISADVMVANGEGYKLVQIDSTIRTGFGVTLFPVKGLTARVYYDFSGKKGVTQTTLATFVGYETNKFSLGAEWMIENNPLHMDERKMDGLSFFGTFRLADKFKAFGRFDQLSSNRFAGDSFPWNIDDNGQAYIAGIEYAPVRGIKVAPNFQGWNPEDETKSFISMIILNIEVKF
jgi:hypothetical protein